MDCWPILRAGMHVVGISAGVIVGRRVLTILDQVWWLKKYTGTWW